MNLILIPILLPLAAALVLLIPAGRTRYFKETLATLTSAVTLIVSAAIFVTRPEALSLRWLSEAITFTLKADSLSTFLLLAVSLFSVAISLYSFSFPKIAVEDKDGSPKWFFFNLLMTQAFAAGAVLADNMVAMLFFWEGLLVFLYTFIALSQNTHAARRTAMKAFLINASTDLCLLTGITITGYIAGTMSMTEISANRLTLDYGWSMFAYILLLIGAVSKAGAFPFHTWIPDAATDSSAPFMAYVPAAIDKLLGIYFLARASVYLFALDGTMQLVLMTLGAVTILVAVMMAFVQSDYKRLLSYHAVSQTGYMILGIGTLNPIGIAGGLFHMINHATYKSCLFMTAGSVERQTGTSDLKKLGGLFGLMPVTAICFLIAAASISGIAPLNGFFSKELVYKGTLDTGYTIFFLAAELGSFLTLASFLKLGHAVFFGDRPKELDGTREAPVSMILPMLGLAAICVAFGFGAKLPIETFIGPALASLNLAPAHALYGFHADKLYFVSVIVILAAVINHVIGLSVGGGKASKASDHIHHAPLLKETYELAERRAFDLYEVVMDKLVPPAAHLLTRIDKIFDWLIDALPSSAAGFCGRTLSRFHNGSYPLYMALTIAGAVVYIILAAGQNGGLK
ncbi:MAG TPA: proton-conducting membrane transporter [Elusimicrobia bacterium]|nr:proton-conducting membrane transporter [Elusimicrobiota bacterium]